jgi:hypothetical protein
MASQDLREKRNDRGALVLLVSLDCLVQSNKRDKPNRPNEQARMADFSSVRLEKYRFDQTQYLACRID